MTPTTHLSDYEISLLTLINTLGDHSPPIYDRKWNKLMESSLFVFYERGIVFTFKCKVFEIWAMGMVP